MRNVILNLIFALSLASVSYSAERTDPYIKFYENKVTCEMLARSKFEADKIIADGQVELLTYGEHEEYKFDAYREKSTETLRKFPIVSKNRELFTDTVIDQLITDGIFVWERTENSIISSPKIDMKTLFDTCIDRKIYK
jgi:hypothetical protein